MQNNPLVSVTIPLYNGGKYIKKTIESVLTQNYKHFELIIVNDGSTDDSKDIILSFTDSRIRFFENDRNSGIVKTRNKGLSEARGKYIAILDADDISLPDRLQKQVEFLETHPDHGLCGTYYEVIDSNGNLKVRIQVPVNFDDIRTFLLFNTCFCHSSVMVRRDLVEEKMFTEGFDIIEDFEMAYRLSQITRLANLPDFVTQYRIHGKNQTIKNPDHVLNLRKKMDFRILSDLQIPFTENELILHSNFINSNFSYFTTNEQFQQLEKWLLKLYTLLEEKFEYNAKVIERIFIKRWLLMFYVNRQLSYRFFMNGLLIHFKTRYLKYFFEFIGDRFSKQLNVA